LKIYLGTEHLRCKLLNVVLTWDYLLHLRNRILSLLMSHRLKSLYGGGKQLSFQDLLTLPSDTILFNIEPYIDGIHKEYRLPIIELLANTGIVSIENPKHHNTPHYSLDYIRRIMDEGLTFIDNIISEVLEGLSGIAFEDRKYILYVVKVTVYNILSSLLEVKGELSIEPQNDLSFVAFSVSYAPLIKDYIALKEGEEEFLQVIPEFRFMDRIIGITNLIRRLISYDTERAKEFVRNLCRECGIENTEECVRNIAREHGIMDKLEIHVLSRILRYVFTIDQYITARRRKILMEEYLVDKGGIYELPYLLSLINLGLPVLPHAKIYSDGKEIPEVDIFTVIPIIYNVEERNTTLHYIPHWILLEISRSNVSDKIDNFIQKIDNLFEVIEEISSSIQDTLSFILISKIGGEFTSIGEVKCLLPSVLYLYLHRYNGFNVPIVIADIVSSTDIHIFQKVVSTAIINYVSPTLESEIPKFLPTLASRST